MTTKFIRDNVLKHSFFDLGVQERAKQLQSWLSNVVTASEPKTVDEAMQILLPCKRKPFEAVNKVSLHNVHAAFFSSHDTKPVRKPLINPSAENSTDEKKSGPKTS